MKYLLIFSFLFFTLTASAQVPLEVRFSGITTRINSISAIATGLISSTATLLPRINAPKLILNRATDDGSGAVLQVVGTQNSIGSAFFGYGTGQSGLKVYNTAGGQDTWLPFTDGSNYIRGSTIMAETNVNDKVGIGHSPSEKLDVNGNVLITGILKFPNAIANRRLSLYDINGNDHQFYGLGLNGGTLRYQVSAIGESHVFYAGSSTTTSLELARFTGSGRLRIGQSDGIAGVPLDVSAGNPDNGVLAAVSNLFSAPGRTGALMAFHQAGISIWRIGVPAGDTERFQIQRFAGGTYPAVLEIDGTGNTTFFGAVNQGIRSKAGAPTTTDITAGQVAIYKNTSDNTVRIWTNNGGTMQSILFQ